MRRSSSSRSKSGENRSLARPRGEEGMHRVVVRGLAAFVLTALAVAFAEPAFAAGDTRLADAAMKRDMPAVRALLVQKVDVNSPGTDGTPALHWFVRVSDVDSAKLLIGAGASPTLANRLGVTPLALASANGDTAMMRLLIDAGANVND